jgi:16S rRNA (guanine1516-N2)-methyltransferase
LSRDTGIPLAALAEPPRRGISLALVAAAAGDVPLASALALQLEAALAPTGTDPATCEEFDVLLLVSGDALALQQTAALASLPGERKKPGRRSAGRDLPGPVSVDFGSDAMRHRRRSGHNELLGRAVGIAGKRRPHVLDATAGLGRDSFVLADMGSAVTLCEREPVIAAMLAQGLQLARAGDDWLRQVAQRMDLFPGDARTFPGNDRTPGAAQTGLVEVIYLDPMFPGRDKSAAVKKEMALFQALLDAGDKRQDADELLRWALAQDVARVVVKRPVRAGYLAGLKPSHSIAGKAVRFDVHVRRALD